MYNSSGNDVGFSPQISNGIYPTTSDSPNALGMLLFEKSSANTEVPKGELNRKSKLTDLMSVSFLSCKSVVSNRLKVLFDQKRQLGIEFLPTSIFNKNEIFNCWIINPFLSDFSFLDVGNTEFVYTDAMGKKDIEKVKFENIEGFLFAYEQNKKDMICIGYPNYRPLIMKKNEFIENCDIDFFSLAPIAYGGIGFFVSENFKKEIEDAGCTGIVFTAPNKRYP